ncbi:FtsK/SpoIIIE domain-containing protein [Kitasatospora purpeofusca]|uniref:FtsK/SpoIIIE domain-containing protein n=1 Tax=Kitasatospora purpeofusca TaxID=67352 RepID=UPI0038635567|nr:FtsK/SpoIIIE domain-containing protein [Kitasatospora purpeofusca]
MSRVENAAVVEAGSSLPPIVWLLGVLVVAAVVLGVLSPWLRRRSPNLWWLLWGFPVAVVRFRWTWRRLSDLQGLSVPSRPPTALLGNVVVQGRALKAVKPRAGMPRWRRGGMTVKVRLHSGQTPEVYAAACGSMAHAWRVFAVRAVSDTRGTVWLVANAWDPLSSPAEPFRGSVGLLSAVVGVWEDGGRWLVNLRRTPHWLIVGATQSGKSTLLASLVAQWARQPVALVGIDLKGGMELGLFAPRLTALATSRREAVDLLDVLVEVTMGRMALCRSMGVRSVWELPEKQQPVPVVVLVDEVAELYLTATSADKAEVAQVSTALLRLGQLGAALGVHLIVAGQRFGSDLGQGATSLRAQLAGRACFRVADKGTAEMTLGDLDASAIDAVQSIAVTMPGVAVALGAPGGGWMRARSFLVTPEQAEETAVRFAHLRPSVGQLYAGSAGSGGLS